MSPRDQHVGPQPGRQTDFLACDADIAIYGGSAGGGKTWSLLYTPLRHMDHPGFGAVIFRRTYPQITVQGGLWDESINIYSLYRDPKTNAPAIPKTGTMTWEFPNHCAISFRHMQGADATFDYQGAQIPLECFDQLEQFEEAHFFFMLSRNRSTCGVRPYVRATANPQPGWLADFLSWWIADDGYANLDRVQRTRYMIRDGASIVWADTPEELKAKHPEAMPLSVRFIPASVYDNPALLTVNPGYLANLMALPETERKRLLGDRLRGGNWKIKPGGTHFKREWFKIIPEAPAKMQAIRRYWDLAATPPQIASGNGHPDYTAGPKLGFLNGQWYICDMRRDRLSPKGVKDLIWQTMVLDGPEVPTRMEIEGGASGKTVVDDYARTVFVGRNFRGRYPSGSKAVRAQPLSAAAEAGNVFLVAGPWNKAFLDEAESFTGDEGKKDDQIDATSSAMADIRESIGGNSIYIPGAQTVLDLERKKCDDVIRRQYESITDPEEKLRAAEVLTHAGFSV